MFRSRKPRQHRRSRRLASNLFFGSSVDRRRSIYLEPLEQRRLLTATLYVANPARFSDSANPGSPQTGDSVNWLASGQFSEVDNLTFGTNAFTSIQAAVNAAGSSGDTIDVAAGTYQESINITQPLSLQGADVGATTTLSRGSSSSDNGINVNTSGSGTTTIAGFEITGFFEGVEVDTGTVVLSTDDITANSAGIYNYDPNHPEVSRGNVTVTDCIVSGNNEGVDGGGILNVATLTVTNSTISNNVVDSEGLFSSATGGGIQNDGTATITDSTISGNHGVAATQGGGVYNDGTLSLVNCTIVGNSATKGGGVYNVAGPNDALTITGGTISGNSASQTGGGVFNTGTAKVANTIVAGNTATTSNPDVSGSFATTDHDLIGFVGSATGFTSAGNDASLVGMIATSPINALLAPLGNYGGPTQTMVPLSGSPALNAGDPLPAAPFTTPTTDQRGLPRLTNQEIDIGATQHDNVVTSGADDGGAGTLRTIITAAAPGDTISFAAGLSQINLTQGQIEINKDLTIQGRGASSLTIDQTTSGGARLFQIDAIDAGSNPVSVSISGLTLSGGKASGRSPADFGGAVYSQGALSLDGMTISDNKADFGGGVYNDSGATLAVANSTFSDSAIIGGGIDNLGTASVADSTFSNSSATNSGGGINNAGAATVTDSTFSGNTSQQGGGGVSNGGVLSLVGTSLTGNSATQGGGGLLNDGTATLSGGTFSGNSAPFAEGGGIATFGTLTMTDSTLTDNSSEGGGALFNASGTATIEGSTFVGNSAVDDENGGGIENDATLIMTDSTLSQNLGLEGGGIYNAGAATVTDSTISGNSAQFGGGVLEKPNSGVANVANTIIAGNIANTDPDIFGTFATTDHDLIGIVGDASGFTDVNGNATGGNVVGTAANPVDPRLAPLANYGGPTETMALLAGSPAIDAGDNSPPAPFPTTPVIDQRGANRIINGTIDIGAVERDDVVTSAADDGGMGTLRSVIAYAMPGDIITFQPGITQIKLTQGEIEIDKDLTIQGPGANLLTIDQTTGGGARLFEIDAADSNNNAVTVSMSGLTLTGGTGGGIYNLGSLSLDSMTLAGNSAAEGGGIYNASGATAVVSASTFSNDTSFTGGGIENDGTATITGSTFYGNVAQGSGGAVNNDGGSLTITDSTVSGDKSDMLPGSAGGAICIDAGTANLANTIVAGNTAFSGYDPDVHGTFSSAEHNLIGIVGDAANLTTTGSSGNIILGTDAASAIGIGPLANNGGPTQTMVLLPGSPALNAGDPTPPTPFARPSTDQRGLPRVVDGAIDIGAIEHENLVTSGADDGSAGTLRTVIAAVAPGDTITFASGLSEIDLTQGQIEINKDLTIAGPGANSLTIDQTTSGGARLFEIDAKDANSNPISVSMSGLTLTGGHADLGGAIDNFANLSLEAMMISGNTADQAGGGLCNQNPATYLTTTTISDCSIVGNSDEADYSNGGLGGAGIYNGSGELTVDSSTITANHSSLHGGGINANGGALTINRSTISGNVCGNYDGLGGGIYIGQAFVEIVASTVAGNLSPDGDFGKGGGICVGSGGLALIDSTVADNHSEGRSGGIANYFGTATITDSTISGNSARYAVGGVDATGRTYLANTIIAGNMCNTDPDVSGFFGDGDNGIPPDHDLIGIVGDATGFMTTGPNASLVGTTAHPIDPLLGSLANNGGPTQTMALLPGSPAINAGDNAQPNDGENLFSQTVATPSTDQRGLPRIVDGTVDIGAFELSRVTASMSGNYTIKLVPGSSPDQNQTEILDPNNNVVFTSPVIAMPSLIFANTGGYTVNLTVDYSAGDPLPAGGLTFDGGGNDGLTVTGYNADTVADTYGDAHSGMVQVGSDAAITYSGLSPLALDGTANNLIVNLPGGAASATLQDDGTPGNNISQLVSPNGAFEATTFAEPTGSLTVNAGAAGDTITVARSFTTDFNANLSLIGGAGDDTFNVYVTPAGGPLEIDGGGSVSGNVLNDFTPGDAEIWSDAGTMPVVTLGSSGQQPISYTAIQQVNVTPGNGVVNVYGDDNQAGTSQNDGYQVVGTGPNTFTLAISGNNANQAGYSQPISFSGVHTLNVNGEAKGATNAHNDANQLNITPYADNTPQGWGVQTFWNQGNANGGGQLVYNGVSGVSENLAISPSGVGAGQLFSTNAATGTPVAVLNYTQNTDIVVNGVSGSAGGSDTLTLKGTNPGASGSAQFTADFATPGSTGASLRISAAANGNTLYTLAGTSNINALNLAGSGAPSQNTLLVDGYNPSTGQAGALDAGLTASEERTSTTAGVVRVFQTQVSAQTTQYPELDYSGIGTLNVNSASSSPVQGPSVAFGSAGVANSGLDGASDSGIAGQPATLDDLITADSTPTFYGTAQAGATVQLYVDMNGNGKVDSGDVLIGEATASATGNQGTGPWTITSTVDLNNPKFGFTHDGLRTILAVAEDGAGDVSSPQSLTILLDTQGPQIGGVSVTGSPNYNLFVNEEPTPTPLVNSLGVTFTEPVVRGSGFVFPAVNPALATTTANYQLVGRTNGAIPITSVTFSDNTAAGGAGASIATLHFATPLVDDFYTLTVSDKILDNAGNALDGDFNGSTFPAGNGTPGGSFTGRFVVNSHPHLAVAANGSVSLDINGDGTFSPSNTVPDSDFIESFGLPNDQIFSGKFASSNSAAGGFDQLGAYGFSNNQWRWLLNLDPSQGTSHPTSFAEPLAINGQPVAGYFAGNPSFGMQVGLFSNGTWWLDVLNHHTIDSTDVAAGGKLKGNMTGTPIVGDFDGDGKTDLATYQNGVFEFDLSSRDAGGKLTGKYNATINAAALIPALASGAAAAPIAADLDGDGITDLGFYVTGGNTNALGGGPHGSGFGGVQTTAGGVGQWFWLVSNDSQDAGGSHPVGAFASLNHAFNPAPLGHDLSYLYGDPSGTPLIGVWDPPTSAAGTSTTMPSSGFVNSLYETVLGRQASQADLTSLNNALADGQTTNPQMAQMFVGSSERLASIINGYYEQYLGRAAEQAGLDYWAGVWRASGGSELVQAGIIGSPEYFATAGRLYPDLSPAAAWVTALYNNLLGRAPEADGLSYWVSYIQTHSLASVVMGFVTSDEYRSGLIDGWYEQYLGRPADSASAAYWLAQMEHGVTQDQLLTVILSSAEFISRSQTGRPIA